MNDTLTARQAQILKALIDEYIATASAVGSELCEKKYNLGVSSATIRKEMVALTKMGYLKQLHTSAGRMPTPKAMKFYVGQLMEERSMSLADEVRTKEDVWDVRNDINRLMEEATFALAQRTGELSVSALDDGRNWHAGLAKVFNNPEFSDLNFCTQVFSFIDETERLQDLFFQKITGASPVEIIFGEELDWPQSVSIGIATTRFNIKGHRGALAVIGPARLPYPTVIPILRYFGGLIEEIAR